MSVLIKTMEMPKDCGECKFCHTENFTTWCCITGREDIFYDAIPVWCPLEKPRWIPVNDMLPSRSGMFLVTVAEKYGISLTVWRAMFVIKLSKWFVSGGEFDTDITDDVLAWMPLPEPYREDGKA